MTTREYEAYQERFQLFMDRNDLDNLSTKNDESGNCEPFFSWQPCDVCGGLAGDRYDCNGYSPTNGIIDDIQACPDCVYFAENRQLDDMTMMDMVEA